VPHDLKSPLPKLTAFTLLICCNFVVFWSLSLLIIPLVLFFNGYHFYIIPALLVYALSYFDDTEKSVGKSWSTFTRLRLWKYFASYFPMHLVRTKILDPSKIYIFGIHPHGIIPWAAATFFTDTLGFPELFPGIRRRGLIASVFFKLPITREFCLWSRFIEASASVARRALDYGYSLYLFPGGEKEALDTGLTEDNINIFLSARKGFIKLALEKGAQLVPVFAFGNNDIYYQWNVLRNIREWLVKKLRMLIVFYYGKGFSFLPRQRPVYVVVGAPIEVVKTPNPTPEQINELHKKYIDTLIKLFEDNKKQLGYEHQKIILV